jgi:hypothetical protein
MTDELMRQEAPYPHELTYLVGKLSYRPGWTFDLLNLDRGQGSTGLTLIITTRGADSYHPERGDGYRVHHYMLVPPASYDRRSWVNWLFEQLLLVERHECAEFFVIGGERPRAPAHGPGNDPYLMLDYGTDLDRRTSFTGAVNPE